MDFSQEQNPLVINQLNQPTLDLLSLEKLPFTHIIEHLAKKLNSAPKVYTIVEVAHILKCKERTVKHHLYEARDLPYLKVGREVRIREEDLKQFLANQLTLCPKV